MCKLTLTLLSGNKAFKCLPNNIRHIIRTKFLDFHLFAAYIFYRNMVKVMTDYLTYSLRTLVNRSIFTSNRFFIK